VNAWLKYRGGKYGNRGDAPQYSVEVSRSGPGSSVFIQFGFDRPADGRAASSTKVVHGVELYLSADSARALSHAVQLALSATTGLQVKLRVDEERGSVSGP